MHFQEEEGVGEEEEGEVVEVQGSQLFQKITFFFKIWYIRLDILVGAIFFKKS